MKYESRNIGSDSEINARFIEEIKEKFPDDPDRVKRMSIIEEGDIKKIRMASMCIVASFSVNGVSVLHTELLKQRIFKDFYELYPDKFNSKTNGITPRRWLEKANPPLSELINATIGSQWPKDALELEKIQDFSQDKSFQGK